MSTEFQFERKQVAELKKRLLEPQQLLQIVSGPRQSGKTTLAYQAMKDVTTPWFFRIAEESVGPPSVEPKQNDGIATQFSNDKDLNWIIQNWQVARKATLNSESGSILIFDEIQKISDWSEIVKGLWDYDRRNNTNVRVVLLESSPLHFDKGKGDSLLGRFEIIHSPYWSFLEMSGTFGFDLDKYIFYGGFPGSVPLIPEFDRWQDYISNSIINSILDKDIFALRRIDKPALFQQLLELSFRYSGQLLSYQKIAGRLQNAGNATTIAHYLDLMSRIGLVGCLSKYSGSPIASKRNPPKLNVLSTGLMSSLSRYSLEEAKADQPFWGRLIESAVGAHLLNTGPPIVEVYYWREKNYEVDFVLKRGPKLVPVEVKSGITQKKSTTPGLTQFKKKYSPTGSILVGQGGIPLKEFLSYSARDWVEYSEYP